ncbi:MAG TPA: [FeFe] hydrogenase H-cluster radical SAM maturase HydE [Bacteroidales bacterium]|nr:[FeFe] hydrogenase H-cluster radical SAM maturase HydE [Bacteroidales bacterium]
MIEAILRKEEFTKSDIIELLNAAGNDMQLIFAKAQEIKTKYVGNKVHLRGIIEYSNICSKNCYYCGIRRDNKEVDRYIVSNDEVIEAAKFAYINNYGSVVIQTGELQSEHNTAQIEYQLQQIKKLSDGKLGVTLSCGEQSPETYQRWFEAGAHRYLLRIETSDKELYKKLHPNDLLHSWEKRIECLNILKEIGYQVGTGVMIGLPFQTTENLADDLLFMKKLDIDMCGMGPYIEHHATPLFKYKDDLLSLNERLDLSLKMLAILRIMMKDINIAATTALQTITVKGREDAIRIASNVVMPNITPLMYRNNYKLYENKPGINEDCEDSIKSISRLVKNAGSEIGFSEWGDSLRFINRNKE